LGEWWYIIEEMNEIEKIIKGSSLFEKRVKKNKEKIDKISNEISEFYKKNYVEIIGLKVRIDEIFSLMNTEGIFWESATELTDSDETILELLIYKSSHSQIKKNYPNLKLNEYVIILDECRYKSKGKKSNDKYDRICAYKLDISSLDKKDMEILTSVVFQFVSLRGNMDVLKNNPSSTHRVYARKSLRPEAKRTDGAWPRISYWVNAQKKWEEYDLEDKWTVEVLKKNLNNNFRGAIDKYTSFTMSPLIEMSEDDFIQAFEEYCKENNRKGHFEESIYKTKSFVFDDK
tara:strand:+ start:136 stop:999 length:864 start_codon:yes stop_codon:yes gene_type:complete